jgi:hypothetical protein
MKFSSLSSLWLCGFFLTAAAAQVPNPQLPANLPNPMGGQNVPAGPFGQPFNNGQAAANAVAARDAILKRFDRDGDGKLSAQEQLAATKAMQEHGIRTPGAPNLIGPGGRNNGNGVQRGGAPQPAQQPAAPKLSKREEMLLKRFDRDGDGKLSNDEKAVARAELGGKKK